MAMANPMRNVSLHWHRLRRTRQRVLDGVRLTTEPDLVPHRVRSFLFKNTYEDAERALVSRTVREGDRVLEIGGGIGFVGLLCARLAGARGAVLSYEANPNLEPVIRANYAINVLRPKLRMKAMSRNGGPVSFHVADNVLSSSMRARPEAEREVTVDSDALCDVLAEHRPDVLVMDVEGAEDRSVAGRRSEHAPRAHSRAPPSCRRRGGHRWPAGGTAGTGVFGSAQRRAPTCCWSGRERVSRSPADLACRVLRAGLGARTLSSDPVSGRARVAGDRSRPQPVWAWA